jgi:hypothetical protein
MRNNCIHSDQLYNWSAYEPLYACFAPTAPNVGQTVGSARTPHSPWLPYRALQAMRQSRLQVPARSRTRAQILPFGQPGRGSPRNGLRPGRVFHAGLRVFAEFPARPPGVGEDLQYQPRVAPAKSEVLNSNAHGAFTPISARPQLRWDPRRQFSAELVASRLSLTHRNSEPRDLP